MDFEEFLRVLYAVTTSVESGEVEEADVSGYAKDGFSVSVSLSKRQRVFEVIGEGEEDG